ncbi:hypothetical protein HYH03_015455 [Edaphochlamys debaryana]|uniref:Uncharacterized protein n=1 Tax=Edaphochlamys debaryana TaxID=47281 RepID=A0A835XM66_9CHLO|nr:hypothetical protein HYH03_015455 [Edaphochlamys debaryana]|eukprot:KAG2485872.1 hypothetical protein HYH03_015455 [Edaphochlamys debaryana]
MWQRKAAAAPAAPLRPATNTDPVGPNRGAARGGPSAEAARTGRQGLASSSSSDASADRDAASRSRRGQGLGQSRMVTPQTSMRRGSTAASAQGSASAFAAASAQGEALRARGSSRSLAVPEELDLDRPASSSSSDAPTLRSAAARQASVSSRQQPSVPVSRASSFRQSEQQAKQQRPSSPLHRAGSNMQPQQEPRSPSASPGAKSSETSVSPRRLGAQTSFRRDSMRVLDTDSELEEEQWHQRQILVGRQVAAETAATAAAAAAGLAGVSPAMAWRMGGAVPSPAPVRLGAHSRTLVLSDGGASEAAGESPGSPPLAEDSDGMGFSGGAVSDGAGVDGSSPSHSQRLDYLPPITHITQQLEQLLQHVNALGLGADSPTRGGAGGGGGWSGGLSPGGVALFPGAATEARPLAPAAGRATPGSPDRLVPTAAAGLGTSPAAPAQSPPRPFPFSPGGSGADVPALLRQLSTLQREVDQLRRTVLLERATGALGPGSGTGAGPGAALSPRTRAALAASALVGPTNVSPVGSGSPGAGRPRSSPGSPHELSANASSLSLRPGASSGGGSTGMAGAGSGRGVANIAPPRGLVLTHPSSAATTAAAIAPLTQRRSVSPSLPAGRLPARIEPLTLATQRGRSASPSSPHMYGPAATPHTLLTDRGRFLGTQLPSDPNHSVGGQDPNQVRSIMAALDSIRGSLTALGDSVEEVQGMMDPESGSPSGSRLASGSGRRARSTSPRSGGRPLSPIRITGRFYGRYSGGGTGDLEGGPSSASLALAEAAAEATAGELPGAAGSPVASPRRGRYDGGFDGSGRGSSRPSSASPRFRGGLSGRVGLVGGGGLGPGAGEVGFTSSTRRLVAALDETVSRLEAVAAEQPAWQAPASPAGRERALAAGVGNVSFGGGAGGWIGGGGVGRTAGAVVSPVASPSVVRMLSMTPAAHPSPPRAVGYSAAGRGGLPAPPASTVPTWDRFSDQGPGALAFAPSSLRGGPLAVPSPVAGLVAATGRPSGRTTVRVVDSPTRRNALSGRGSSPPGSPHTRAQPRSPPLDAYPDAPAPVTAMAAAMLPGGRLLLMDGLSPPHSPAGSRPGSPHRTARPRSPAAASAAAAAAAPGGDGMAGLTANVLPGGRLRVAEAPNPARRSRSASPASSAGRASPSRSPPRRLDADAAGASHTTTTFARTGRTGPASAAAAAAAAATGVMRLGPVVGAATATAAAGAGRRAQLPARSPGRPRLAPVSTLVSAFISAARRGTGLQDATLPSFLPPSSAATGVAAPTGRAIGDLGLDRDPHNISRHASPLQSRSPSPSPSPSPRREASSPGLAGSPRRPMTMTTTAAAQTSPLRPHGYLALGSPPRSSPQRPLSTSPYASPRGRRATVSAQTSPQRSLGSLGLMRLASLPRGQAVLQSVQRTHASARPTSPIFPPGSTAAAIAAAAAPRTSYGAASGANRRTLEQVLSGLAALPATATPTAGFTALAAAAAARPAAPATTMAALTPAAGGGGGGRSLSPRLQAMQAETLSRLRVAGAPTVGLAGGLGRGYSSSAGAAPEAARGPGPSLAPLSAADLLPPHGAYGAPADRGSRRYSPPHRSHGGSGPGAARSGATPSFAAAGFATPKPVPGTAVATPNARATRDAAEAQLRVLMHLAAAASSAHAETEKARVEAEARLAAQAMAGASAELHRREAEAQAGLSGLLGLALGADQQEHEEQQESSSPSLLLGMPWGAAPGRGPSAADGGGEAELGRPRRLLDSLAAADEEAASASATVPTMEHERVSFEAEGVGEALVGERNVPASPLSGLTAGTPGPQALSGQSGAEALDREGSEPHERPASPVPVQPRSQGAGSYGPQASPQNSLPVLTSPGVGAEAVRLGSPPACSPMHLPHPTTTAAATAPSSALPSRSAEDAECLPALSPPPTRGGPAFMSSAAASAPSASGLLAQAGASRYATFAESPESPVPYALPADAEAEEEGDCTEDPAALASAAPSARSPARSEGLAPGSVPRESSGGDSRSGGSSSGGGRGSRAEARLAPATAASVSSQPVGSEATECGRLTAAPGPLQQRSAIQGGHSGQALKPAAPGVRLPLQQQSDVAPQPQLQPMLQAPPAAGLAGGRPGAAAAAPAPAGVQGEAAGTALLRRAPPQPAGPQPIRHAAGVAAAGDWVHANAAPQPPNRQAAVVVQPSLPTVRSGEGVRASVVAAARLSSTLLPSGPDDTPAPLPAESPALLGRRGGPGLEPLHRQPAANPGGDGKEDRWHASASTSSLAHPYAYPATSYEEGHDRSRLAPASTVTGYRHTLRAPLEQQLQPQSHTLARGPALHGPRAHWPGAVQGVVLAPARLSQTLAQAGFRQPATQAQPQAHLQDGLGQAPLHPHHSVPGDRGQAMQPGSLGQGGQGQGQRQALAALMASLQALNGVTQSACARMLDEFGGQGRGA